MPHMTLALFHFLDLQLQEHYLPDVHSSASLMECCAVKLNRVERLGTIKVSPPLGVSTLRGSILLFVPSVVGATWGLNTC